jgi:hypothetical protein
LSPLRTRARHRSRASRLRPVLSTAVVLAGGAATLMFLHVGARESVVRAQGLADPALATPIQPSRPTSSPSSEPRDEWQAFAQAKGVKLFLPAPHPVAVTYHEASLDFAAEMRPLGRPVRNANKWRFDPPSWTPGPDYIVMSSRGRSAAATSAADIVLRPRTPVRTPVTGRVIHVQLYHLYCRYSDMRVAIKPRGHPDYAVVLIHLAGVHVREGQLVFARLSVLGHPRRFPFRSQVDDYVRGGNPHVHIEVAKPHQVRRSTC